MGEEHLLICNCKSIRNEENMPTIESQLNVRIIRKAEATMHPFTDHFKGFENVGAVRQIFGEETEEVLRNLKVEFSGRNGYMGVSDDDGHLMVSACYLNNGDIVDIYLDIVHELVHVKQFMDGKELFERDYDYVERPTEIEAYRHVVEEARRLGLDDDRIREYLRTEWMSDEDLTLLAKIVGVKCKRVKEKANHR
jgi:hypothetical protein